MPTGAAAETLYTIRLRLPASVPDDKIADMASVFETEAISTSWEKNRTGWEILWLVGGEPQPDRLAKKLKLPSAEFQIEAVPDTNWLEDSYRRFPPFRVADFFIHGSHFEGISPPKTHGLQIDAATAFGSGEHGTTAACLEMLARLKAGGTKPKNILDMGTGSGILGIAAFRLWKKPVLAVDNDPESVRVACRHRAMNKIPAGPAGMACACGDGYKTRKVKAQKPFDLIIANILAGPLIDMAPELKSVLAPKAFVILSGLLVDQEKAVAAAHRQQGLKKISRIVRNGWVALLLQNGA